MKQLIRAVTLSITLVFAGLVTGFFVPEAQAEDIKQDAILLVPDVFLGNVDGTEEVYEPLQTELAEQGYDRDEEFHVFQYDPYLGMDAITEQLSQELAEISGQTQDDKVKVIGYGVGGLIVRNYLESEHYTNDVESLVFISVPHQGTLAYIEMYYDKKPSRVHPWEHFYWMNREIPKLLREVVTPEIQVEDFSSDAPEFIKIREIERESILDELLLQESDALSPIQILPTVNMNSGTTFMNNIFSPIYLGNSENRQGWNNRIGSLWGKARLENNLHLHRRSGWGDGYDYHKRLENPYVEKISIQTNRRSEAIHGAIGSIFREFNIPRDLLDLYVRGLYSSYTPEIPYPKYYESPAFEVKGEDLTIEWNLPKHEGQRSFIEDNIAGFYFATSIRDRLNEFTQPIEVTIESSKDQTIELNHLISYVNNRGISASSKSFDINSGEKVTLQFRPAYLCSSNSRGTPVCREHWHAGEEFNTWNVISREQVDYPIILVHGILGSLNTKMLFDREVGDIVDTTGAILHGLDAIPDSISPTEWYKFPLGLDKTWDKMIPTLESVGYVEGENLFQFSYDWREPNQKSAADLKLYIDQVKSQTGASKVNVIAHSMGGLVTRSYIEDMAYSIVDYTEDGKVELGDVIEYENDIHKFVMAGTPNLGSADAIPKWYGGDTYTSITPVKSLAEGIGMQLLLTLKNIGSDTRNLDKLRREIPSTRELLPVYDDSRAIIRYETEFFDSPYTIEYMDRIEDNLFLDELNQKSQSDSSNLDRVDVLAIAGEGQDTAKSATFSNRGLGIANPFSNWKFNYNGENLWFNYFEIVDGGDSTVLVQSGLAEDVSDRIIPRPVIISGEDQSAFSHGTIYHSPEVMSAAIDFINPNILPQIEEGLVDLYKLDNYISVNMYSPADISVTLPDGTVISEETPLEVMKEKRAVYMSQGSLGHKSIIVPNIKSGDYEIDVVGTGEGEYTLTSTYVNAQNQVVATQSEGVAEVGKEEEFIVEVNQTEDGLLDEESFEILPKNTPPTPILNQELYTGVEEEPLIFDASGSSDEQNDPLQYKWTIQDEYESEYSVNPVFEYTFEDSYTGVVILTVTDGEFEETVTAQVEIRAKTVEERISDIRQLISSLEEDTKYISSKRRLWLQLLDMLELPVVQENQRLQDLILDMVYRDVQRTIAVDQYMDELQSRFRFWWWRRSRDLVSDKNETVLGQIVHHFQEIEQL